MLYILSIYVLCIKYYINRKNFKFLTFFTKVLTAREREWLTKFIKWKIFYLFANCCELVMFMDKIYTRFILFQYPYTKNSIISIIFHIVTDFSWNSQLCKRIWFIILSWNSPLCNKSLEQRYHPKLSEP